MTILAVLIPAPSGSGLGGAAAHIGTLSHAAATGGHLGFWAGVAIGAAFITGAFLAKTFGQHLLRRRQSKKMPAEFDFDSIRQRANEMQTTVDVPEDRRFAVPYLAHAAATVEAIRSRPDRREERGLEW